MGGFGFYFAVVVPVGGKVLGGSEQGFVTQQVTHWLNLIGLFVLPFLLWNAAASHHRLLITSWLLLAVLQAGLFAMHHRLDSLIDAPSRIVKNDAQFHRWHEWYETVATIQFLVAAIHLGGITRSALGENVERKMRTTGPSQGNE
jgi:hypothetical protein